MSEEGRNPSDRNEKPKGSQIRCEPRAARKRIWPWVLMLITLFCLIYAYERVTQFLAFHADDLPVMLFDFVIEYFLEDAARHDVSDI